MVANVGKIGGN